MPRYSYRCGFCESVFDFVHSVKERYTVCPDCHEGPTLERILNCPVVLNKKKSDKGKKTGDEVKSHIEDAKKELKKHKEQLKNRSYEK
jgi:putative FmdB family regulatory protein